MPRFKRGPASYGGIAGTGVGISAGQSNPGGLFKGVIQKPIISPSKINNNMKTMKVDSSENNNLPASPMKQSLTLSNPGKLELVSITSNE